MKQNCIDDDDSFKITVLCIIHIHVTHRPKKISRKKEDQSIEKYIGRSTPVTNNRRKKQNKTLKQLL